MAILKQNRFLNPEQIMSGLESDGCYDGNGRIGGLRIDNFPKTNIFEETDRWVYTFEIPGVDPNDLKISIRNTLMTVRGKRSSFYEGEESRIHCRESCVGECDFTRAFQLPGNADLESIHVHVKHGMLFVTVEKIEKNQEKMIEIDIEQNG